MRGMGPKPAAVKRAQAKCIRLEKQIKKLEKQLDKAQWEANDAIVKWQKSRGVYG